MTLDRRDFLRLSSLASVGCCTLGATRASANNGVPTGDYKALVVIMLRGGNDAHNMLLPLSATDAYATYAATRGSLAVADTTLTVPDATIAPGANPYRGDTPLDAAQAYLAGMYALPGMPLGVNSVMPEIAQLLESASVKAVLNTGNLVGPTSKAQIEDGSADLPLFLFAHNHQRRQLELGRADQLNGPGWAGQLADRWFGAYDPAFPLGLNVSMDSASKMLTGERTTPVVLPSTGPTAFNPFAIDGAIDSNVDRLAANRRALYQYLMGDPRAPRFDDTVRPPAQDYTTRTPRSPENLFEQAYQRLGDRSDDVLAQLNDDWQATQARLAYTSADLYGNRGSDLFAIPSADDLNLELPSAFGSFIAQLAAIATMIKLASDQGYGRQIFLAHLDGFDTHSNQAETHPALLRELSLGLDKFHKAMGDLGLADNVLAYTQSDFGRTLSNNGDGTDHGWATHQLVLGGGMRTPGMLGDAPSLALGSDDDISDKGRLIPTLANDQLTATAVDWFGVTRDDLRALLPNLANFARDPGDIASALLGELLT
ncbi:MAG: DUF1501 domain-containing protein [Pseudomonadota bacterium]